MRIATFRSLTSCCALVLLVACGGGSYGGGSTPPPVPAPSPTPPPSAVTLAVERVFPNLSFSNPVAMLQAPGDTTRWFVVEQNGVVRVFPNDPATTPAGVSVFVDISARVASPADGRGGETGLLGMAFHPQFATDRRVFLSYTALDGNQLESRISEFRSSDAGATLDPTPAAERMVLTIDQPQDNHNGGGIAFGPGGLLFIGIGDGGNANDEGTGHNPTTGNAQDVTRLLGKMLRINITATTSYQTPADNPFTNNPQCGPGLNAQPCPEIFAWGFRNPWRWSFDRSTGDLWVGDVGQGALEEVDRVLVNQNFGWRCREGTADFRPNNCGSPPMLINPIAEYGRAAGNSVIGGYVYRGAAIPGLQGRYVFGDLDGSIWHIAGDTMATLDVTNAPAEAPHLDSGLTPISSFAEGNDGELYVVSLNGTLHRLRAQ